MSSPGQSLAVAGVVPQPRLGGHHVGLDGILRPTQDQTPYAALRRLVPINVLRQRGTFFTSETIAQQLWMPAFNTIGPGSVIVDPACGAADLLLPAMQHIANMPKTPPDFEVRAGDIDPAFVRTAGARLYRAAGSAKAAIIVKEQNFLDDPSLVIGASHIALNPPYIPMQVSTDWGRGTVNAASVFVDQALRAMENGATLLAVLPDVLRSGARYANWRRHVESIARIQRVESLGQFDRQTDVHVFILQATKGAAGESVQWQPKTDCEVTDSVGARFHVRVGAVVPHRHQHQGALAPFITARSLTSGEALTRAFDGRRDTGPMVLINRTSRPGEVPRARARLWTDNEPAAVENHLLVATPKHGGLEACNQLMKVLGDARAADFLDQRIRCRHLTVSAIKEIPWLI